MSYNPEPDSHSNKIRVGLELSNYAPKSDLNGATGMLVMLVMLVKL